MSQPTIIQIIIASIVSLAIGYAIGRAINEKQNQLFHEAIKRELDRLAEKKTERPDSDLVRNLREFADMRNIPFTLLDAAEFLGFTEENLTRDICTRIGNGLRKADCVSVLYREPYDTEFRSKRWISQKYQAAAPDSWKKPPVAYEGSIAQLMEIARRDLRPSPELLQGLPSAESDRSAQPARSPKAPETPQYRAQCHPAAAPDLSASSSPSMKSAS